MKYSKITIAGKVCTGKTTLLRLLEKKLSWPTFLTGKLFRQYAAEQGLTLEAAEEQTEYLTKKVDYKMRELLKSPGNLIVDGWMSGIMANKNPQVLKVLLVCQDVIRYKRFAKREKITLGEAKKSVEERQNNWFKKIQQIHHVTDTTLNDENTYDLVINTSYVTPQAVAKKVLEKLN